MYVPRHFEMPPDEAVELARRVGVGHLVTASGGRPESTMVPFLIQREPDGLAVLAHVAAANPHRHAIVDGAPAMLIVQGPNTYVSPSLYASKADHGRVVPTWNYALVHLHGTLRRIDDPRLLLALVAGLTDHHEKGRGTPWSVDDAPADFITAQLKAIVGLQLVVESVEGKAKLSQNRPDADRSAVRAAFLGGDPHEVAVGEMMR